MSDSNTTPTNPLNQFPIVERIAAFVSCWELRRLRQINYLWRKVALSELDRRRRCDAVKHGLVSYECSADEPHNLQRQRRPGQLPYSRELSQLFDCLMTELRADWHAPARLLIFCDSPYLKEVPCRLDSWTPPAPLPPIKRLKRLGDSAEDAAYPGTLIHAMSCFSSAELPPGGRLYLVSSIVGAIGTPAPIAAGGALGATIEMETSLSSECRQMHGIAHLRIYSSRRFGVVSAGEPLPPDAEPKLLLALPSQLLARRFGGRADLPEEKLLREHPRMIVCAGLFHEFHTFASAAAAGNPVDPANLVHHNRLVFYGDRLRVLSAIVKGEDDMESTLRSLNTEALQPLVPGHCLAFVFICCAKGCKAYGDRPDVETAAFRRVFPDVPAMGLFSQGEFGRNCSPGDNFAEHHQRSQKLSLQGYRTSVCVLSWS